MLFNLGINWDLSGFKEENVYDLMGFALNKEGKCKNVTGLFCQENKNNGEMISVHEAIKLTGSNNNKEICVRLSIDMNTLPIYCKEIMFFAVSKNACNKSAKFSELEFFNVYQNIDDKFNTLVPNYYADNEKISEEYRLKNICEITNFKEMKTTGIFHIGNLVRVGDQFEFSQVFEFLDKDLVQLGANFDIKFIE